MPNGLPTDWAKLVSTIGFPAVVALLLLAALFGWIPSPSLTSSRAIEATLKSHTRDDGTRTYLLRRICQHSATTKEEAWKCLQDSE